MSYLYSTVPLKHYDTTNSKDALHQGSPQSNVAIVEINNEAALERPQFQEFEKVRNRR